MTLWFVGLLHLWRSKDFVSMRWGEEKTRLTTVAFSPMKPSAWSSMTIHKVWQPWVRGWRVKFQCLLLIFKNPQMTITVHLIKWKGGTDIQAFDKGPAVHVSLAVIYTSGGRQGESLYGWAGAADFKTLSFGNAAHFINAPGIERKREGTSMGCPSSTSKQRRVVVIHVTV